MRASLTVKHWTHSPTSSQFDSEARTLKNFLVIKIYKSLCDGMVYVVALEAIF